METVETAGEIVVDSSWRSSLIVETAGSRRLVSKQEVRSASRS